MSTERGFTLVEVLVALVVGALVVLMAHRSFAVAGDLAVRVGERREAHDREMNARRFLSRALGSLEVGTVSNTGFAGMHHSVVFASWLPDESGTLTRRQVSVLLDAGEDRRTGLGLLALATRLPLDGTGPDTLVLAPEAVRLDLDYLLDFGADASWAEGWRSQVSAPVAVRLRVAREDRTDTLVIAIGPRG